MKTEFLKSVDVYQKMSLEQLKDLRDAFERDLASAKIGPEYRDDFIIARICYLNWIIQERILKEREENQ